jgi:SAM-dependent methyltransferase
VHLVDPVPLHVRQAEAAGGFTAALGDARDLAEADSSCDAVLLLGPLYHLTSRADRLRALSQARRVVRPGGLVAAAVISRYASMFDGFFRRFVDQTGFTELMTADLRTGQHRNPGRDPGFFTTSYFHDRDGIAGEISEAGLLLAEVLPVEGPLHWAPGIQDRLADPAGRQLILDALAALEHDPAMAGATAHLLAISHSPQQPLQRG